MTAQKILIIGSTGSIGTQALEVIADNPQLFEVVGLAAGGSQRERLIAQARTLGLPSEQIAVADKTAAEHIGRALGGAVLTGSDAAARLCREIDCDVVLNAMDGSRGLPVTLAALEQGVKLALANKESLVAGGRFVLERAAAGQIIPVDSEHSAMAQALRAGQRSELSRLVLTASGGPFRGWSRAEMRTVTPAQASAHPTWSMGQMNTLNSATLINKGLELIEASLLFDISAEQIDVVVHPQSMVHSMATFSDGASIAKASPPSMKLPIALALNWPHRVPAAQHALDWTIAHTWEFYPVDNTAFPAVELARAAASTDGLGAVYNAANEEAAEAFLNGRIAFPTIVDIVAEVMEAMAGETAGGASLAGSVDEIYAVENQARRLAQQALSTR